MRPNWNDVAAWNTSVEIRTRLTELIGERKVIYVDGGSERLLFTHDRFLESLCAECVPGVICDAEVRSEPFYAEIIGRSIADNLIHEDAVPQIVEENPLAVFCALSLARDSALQRKLVDVLRQWAMAEPLRSVPLSGLAADAV
jgi:hypothetical protein